MSARAAPTAISPAGSASSAARSPAMCRSSDPRRGATPLVVVISEFGRTFRENGNKGTDHGHGSVYWVLGGAVKGGRLAGEQVKVSQASLFQNRDYPVLTDYRMLLGGLFQRAYGLDRAALEKIFPGAPPRDLALV